MTTVSREELERARRTARALTDDGAKSQLDRYLDKLEQRMAKTRDH